MYSLASVILYASIQTGLPCRQVFMDAALLFNPGAKEEIRSLERFADASCLTDNPDILWQIAYVESGLRFKIVRVNQDDGGFTILTGKKAAVYLKKLKRTGLRVNADLGVIQMNWAAQREGYHNDPFIMMDPRNQVAYLVNKMVSPLVAKCGENWIGCYHSWANGKRAREYMKKVVAARMILRRYVNEAVALRYRARKIKAIRENVRAGRSLLDEILAAEEKRW